MGTFGAGVFGGGGDQVAGAPAGTVQFSVLLKAALRKAGVTLAPGRGPSPTQMAEAAGEVGRMMGSWSANPLLYFTKQIDVWSTSSGKKTYTLGPGGDWDGPRPQQVYFANLFLPTSPVIRRKMNILNAEQWEEITYQDILTYPADLYNSGGNVGGRTTIYLHPTPDAVYQLELYTWQPLLQYTSVDDFVVLPPGYEDAIVNCGAVRLASMPWPVQVPMNPQVRIDAAVSLALLQSMNAKSPRGQTDPALRGGGGFYNYLTGLVEG